MKSIEFNDQMSEEWSPLAKVYDPIKVGSIDGTDTRPHDKALIRALNVWIFSMSFQNVN